MSLTNPSYSLISLLARLRLFNSCGVNLTAISKPAGACHTAISFRLSPCPGLPPCPNLLPWSASLPCPQTIQQQVYAPL